MSTFLEWPDYLVFVLLLVVYGAIGVFYGFQSNWKKCWQRCRHGIVDDSGTKQISTDEMFLGSRQLTLLPIMGSAMASFMSAVALMGNNSEVYRFGIQFWVLILGYCIAFPVAAEVFTPVFYKLGLTSAHEVFV